VNIFQLKLRSGRFYDDDDDDDDNNVVVDDNDDDDGNNNNNNNNIAIQGFPNGCTFILLEKEIFRKNTRDDVRPLEEHAFLTFSDNAEQCSCVLIFLFIASMY
jgi:hypothetical protein